MSEPIVTLTGYTMEEVRERMKRVLHPSAYSESDKAYLTDINPGYLTEALADCFGLAGYGWGFNYENDDLMVTPEVDKNGKILVILYRFELWYIFGDARHRVFAAASNRNYEIGDAINGAITSALGKAASKLEWQIGVYKGIVNHNNAQKYYEQQEGSK